jgi:beta-N-acetylhexosaminidase
VLAVKAGVDVVVKSPDIDAAMSALKAAVEKREITMERLDQSVKRVLEAKVRLSLDRERTIPLDLVDQYVSNNEARIVAQEIAEKSITLLRNDSRLLPLSDRAPSSILHLTITDEDDRAVMMPLTNELKSRNITVYQAIIDQRTRDSEVDEILKNAGIDKASLVLVSLAVRARSGKGALGLNEAAKTALAKIKTSGRPIVAFTFGSPYLLKAFDGLGTYLAAYSAFPVSQKAAARALLGEIAISGKLPVTIPELFPRGHGLRVEKK